jgi:hypothetical protein
MFLFGEISPIKKKSWATWTMFFILQILIKLMVISLKVRGREIILFHALDAQGTLEILNHMGSVVHIN